VAFFPHVRGSVWLTASAYRVMVAAERLGIATDKLTSDRMEKVLTAALRSDYPHLLDHEELFDRVSALLALADAGKISPDYAAELARQSQTLRTGSLAEVATVLARLPKGDPRLLALVVDAMWGRVNLLARDGKPAYAGLVDQPATAAILPSEARSLAEVTQAAATATPGDSRLPILRTALLNMADGQGWGSTNATAAALQALAATWQAPTNMINATVSFSGGPMAGVLDATHPMFQAKTTAGGPIHVQARAGVVALAATDYVPLQPGAHATSDQHGFVLTRTLFRVPPMQGSTQPPMTKIEPANGEIHLSVGDVVEEVDELVNPEMRSQVALHLPIAAGMEPLNPALATAVAEATPSQPATQAPSWSSYGDDGVTAVYLSLPPGTITLRTRLRATIVGSFTAPPASVEMLYQLGINASTPGARVVVSR
jgi:uncharacterized protein YfaS (alpha-2-macroglobulin family)